MTGKTNFYYTDDVSGIVIGDITFPYQFWLHDKDTVPGQTLSRCVARNHFANDNDAAEWFKTNFPSEFVHGVEMRVYDQL